MKNVIKMSLVTAVMMSTGAVSAQAEGMNVLSDVKFKGELRPRYEYVDSDAKAKDAGHIFTNRTNLNIESKLLEVDGLKATLELNSVNDFNSLDQTTSQASDAPKEEAAVAKMTQANISYKAGDVTGIVGRKTVNLDNQRFVGSVGWKQNFQTLDLAAVTYSAEGLDIMAAYVYGVNAIADAGNDTAGMVYTGGTTSGDTESAILNASYKVGDALKLTGYGYLLGSHSDTYGLALTGAVPVSDGVKINYRAEYAMQSDPSMKTKDLVKPTDVDSTYMNFDLNTNLSGLLLGVNYEVLGANDDQNVNKAFQTPLATKHKFNGFADQFLVTPGAGLVDANIMVGYKAEELGTLKAIYHTFESDRGSIDYGSEIDLIYTNKIPGFTGVTGMLKGAFYSGDSEGLGQGAGTAVLDKDVTKVWVMLDYKFSI